MRVCLVVHGFPPEERTGVENYTAWLAAALVRAGCIVEVFAPRRRPGLAQHSVRREERDGYGVTWLTCNHDPGDPAEALDPAGVALAFGEFLDRERPQLVHLQHLVKLGVSLVDVARERGLPVVYTAHDYYPVCHRYTLLRPDLTRCTTLGDPAACARCDLALAGLNRIEGLGDYQAGMLPAQLEADDRAALAAALAGEEEGAGLPPGEHAAAVERRRALDERRAHAFAGVDLILAPTAFLRDRLVEGGLDAERVEVLGYGIDVGRLAGLTAPDPSGRQVRFGFLGGLSKHKGVQVLLDAFALLREPAELLVWGHTTDAAHLARLRERAVEVGARWMGAYGSDELAGCLAEVDVVVVPSIWVENQPIVIREAFAARRPVLASDLGALPESVRDGVDGLLFTPDDPAALSQALGRCVREEGLVAELASGTATVKDADEQAAELVRLYERLLESPSGEHSGPLPAHLAEFAGRHRALDALPSRELFVHVLGGLASLRAELGGVAADLTPEQALSDALSTGDHARELLRDNKSELAWTRDRERALTRQLTWMEEVVADRERSLEEWRQRSEEAARACVSLEAERDWMKDEIAARDEELGWLKGQLEVLRADLLERVRQAAALGVEAMRTQRRMVGAELQSLIDLLEQAEMPDGDDAGEPAADIALSQIWAAIRGAVDQTNSLLAKVAAQEQELKWRRDEMRAIGEEASRRLVSLLLSRTGVGVRLRQWSADGDAPGPEESAP